MRPNAARTLTSPVLLLCLAVAARPTEARAPEPPLSREASVQAIIESELGRADQTLSPTAAVVVVLDARSGRVVAMAGREHGRSTPTLGRERAWVTGSTLKPLTLAAALDAGAVTADTVVDCAPRRYAQGELHDWKLFGRLALRDAIAVSSNVASSRVLDALGLARLVSSQRALGLFDAPGTWPEITDPAGLDAAKYAAGELALTSPLRLASAYAALFDEGRYHAPTGGSEVVFQPKTAATMLDILEQAVAGPLGTGHAAMIPGHRVAGKTGTAELPDGRADHAGSTWASFVGAVLDVTPREVILVGFEGVPDGSGGKVAAPVFARIATRMLELAP